MNSTEEYSRGDGYNGTGGSNLIEQQASNESQTRHIQKSPAPESAKPVEPPPSGELNKVTADAKANLKETTDSLSKAKDAIGDLMSGKVNVADAAFAIKGAFDAVQGLTANLSASAMMPVMKALAGIKGQAILPAGKQMDPVMGIDVHMVTIPPSPAPVPLPHPYIGMLFNPKDFISCAVNTFKPAIMAAVPQPAEGSKGIGASLAKNADAIMGIAMGVAGLSASVKFGSFIPRAVTGTPTKNIPHIPMGAGFHPAFVASVAKNNGKAFLGSLFVAADGDPMVGSFHLHYDCWDVGIVDLFKGVRKGTKKASPGSPLAELFVPSGTVLPIPWGKPVLVNSIPTPVNPLAILDKLFKAGLAKLKAAGKKAVQKGLDKLTGKVGCGTLSKVSKLIGTGQSHPVDVAAGHFYTDNIDFSLPGPIPLVWERTWYSYSDYNGPLGCGWHHSYDMALAVNVENNLALLRMGDGRLATFDFPPGKEASFNRHEKLFLATDVDGSYQVTDRTGNIFRFTRDEYFNTFNNTNARLLQSVSNKNGFAIRFVYNKHGILSGITDSADRKLKVRSNETGRLISIEVPNPDDIPGNASLAVYDYSKDGDMTMHGDALEDKIFYSYRDHLMIEETWKNGLKWNFRYDGKGRNSKCVEVIGEKNLLHYLFDYSNSSCTIVTNSLGHTKKFYHKNGLVTRYVGPEGEICEYRFNQFNELESEIDPSGMTTGFARDDWGNLISVIKPDGGVIRNEFRDLSDPFLCTSSINPVGARWTWKYDFSGNLIETADPLGYKKRYEYRDGVLVNVINATGQSLRLQYDTGYNLTTIIQPNNTQVNFGYNSLGFCTKKISARGRVQRKEYDLKGRIRKIMDFDGNEIILRYDSLDNLVTYKDDIKYITYSYYGINKLASRSDSNATVYFNYDTEQQLRRVINEQGQTYEFDLDKSGNVIREKGFDGQIRNFTRNASGRALQELLANGASKKYAYDPCGRLSDIFYSNGAFEKFTYRQDGELLTAINQDATVSFERDILGNVLLENNNGEWIKSEYTFFNNRAGLSSSLGANIRHEYSDSGQVLQTGSEKWQKETRYDDFGSEVERSMTGGILQQIRRDDFGRTILDTVQEHKSNGVTAALKRQYRWGVRNKLLQLKTQNETIEFEYDDWSNLSASVHSGQAVEFRKPDSVGNLYESVKRDDRIYASGSMLRTTNKWQFEYDILGNRISKRDKNGLTWKYRWNEAGMLESVLRPDGLEIKFKYDALARRISKQVAKTETRFLWDGNTILHEWKVVRPRTEISIENSEEEKGLVTWVFEFGKFTPSAKKKGEKSYSIVSDYLGTPVQMFEENGRLVWNGRVDSYGNLRMLKTEGITCPFRYQGQYHDDETGLCYNRFRYYDPETGMYISQDPLRLNSGQPNLYSYVTDTNLFVDVFGLYNGEGERELGEYDPHHEHNLKPSEYKNTDSDHFAKGNESLHNRFQNDPAFANSMESKYPGIKDHVAPGKNGKFSGDAPAGTTWHHHETPGKLVLVDRADHKKYHKIYHPDGEGGRKKWGGGDACR